MGTRAEARFEFIQERAVFASKAQPAWSKRRWAQ
jgi:hypothetical protein